jgi:hypothetical protein
MGHGVIGNGNRIIGWQEIRNFGRLGDTYAVVECPSNVVLFDYCIKH